MSIAHVKEQIEAALEAQRTAAKATRDQHNAVRRNLQAAMLQQQSDANDAALQARLIDQYHQDEQSSIVEELSQLDGIVNGPPAHSDNQAAYPAPAASQPEPPPAPPAVPPTPPQEPAQTRRMPRFNGRPRGWIQWLLAVIGLVIGVLVALSTYHPLFGHVHNIGRYWLNGLWFIALGAFGFYVGDSSVRPRRAETQ